MGNKSDTFWTIMLVVFIVLLIALVIGFWFFGIRALYQWIVYDNKPSFWEFVAIFGILTSTLGFTGSKKNN